MATQDLAAAPTEAVSMDEIKKLYPGEWVLLANPVRAENGVDIVSGIPLDHSWDKRELAYRWRGNLTGYKTYTLKFVRPDGPVRKYNRFIPFITRRTQML
jgi:hypothetical protein